MREPSCRFCLGNNLLSDKPIGMTDHFYFLASADPALPQAAMVIPKRHSGTPFEMNAAEWSDFPVALAAIQAHFGEDDPDGYTLGWNVGAAAGQTVGHTHLHVIPRFAHEPLAGKGIRHAFKSHGAGET